MSIEGTKRKAWIGAGLLTAIAASLCCITPVLAIVAGISGAASAFSWLEPLRPYMIGITVIVLGFAWYQAYKPKKIAADCNCEESTAETPQRFTRSKPFLWVITGLAAIMITFPYYSGIFFEKVPGTTVIKVDPQHISTVMLDIEGMTCTGCEHHVNHALAGQEGVIESNVSYEEGYATVKFDRTITTSKTLSETVERETGYIVKGYEEIN